MSNVKCTVVIKVELPKESILFRTQFPSLGIFNNEKVGFRKKLRPPKYTT